MEKLCGTCGNPIEGEAMQVRIKLGFEVFHKTTMECMEAEHTRSHSLFARANRSEDRFQLDRTL